MTTRRLALLGLLTVLALPDPAHRVIERDAVWRPAHPDVIDAQRNLEYLKKRAADETCQQDEDDPKKREHYALADRLIHVMWSDQIQQCYRLYPAKLSDGLSRL
jgi:hypothetical protein